jgi:hypothetical protein
MDKLNQFMETINMTINNINIKIVELENKINLLGDNIKKVKNEKNEKNIVSETYVIDYEKINNLHNLINYII